MTDDTAKTLALVMILGAGVIAVVIAVIGYLRGSWLAIGIGAAVVLGMPWATNVAARNIGRRKP